MASGDIFATFGARDLTPGSGPSTQLWEKTTGAYTGLPLGKVSTTSGLGATKVGDAWYGQFKVWNNGTPLSTGLTAKVLWTDGDGQNANSGGVAVVGLSMAKITSGTTDLASITWGTETTASLTAPSTATVETETSMAVTTANAGSPSAGGWVAFRLRRLPANSSDTHTGRVLLTGLSIQDT